MPHPNESGSLASVGIDGAVCTWDVGPGRSGRGRCTARFDNILAAGPQSEALHHGMPVTVLDGVFSPDGGMLAVTDLVSHVEEDFFRALLRGVRHVQGECPPPPGINTPIPPLSSLATLLLNLLIIKLWNSGLDNDNQSVENENKNVTKSDNRKKKACCVEKGG